MKSNRMLARCKRRKFSEEFEADAVRMVTEGPSAGATLTQIGRELDVRPEQVRAWAQLQRNVTQVGDAAPDETVEHANRRLRREVAALRQEQYFVRKVAAGSKG